MDVARAGLGSCVAADRGGNRRGRRGDAVSAGAGYARPSARDCELKLGRFSRARSERRRSDRNGAQGAGVDARLAFLHDQHRRGLERARRRCGCCCRRWNCFQLDARTPLPLYRRWWASRSLHVQGSAFLPGRSLTTDKEWVCLTSRAPGANSQEVDDSMVAGRAILLEQRLFALKLRVVARKPMWRPPTETAARAVTAQRAMTLSSCAFRRSVNRKVPARGTGRVLGQNRLGLVRSLIVRCFRRRLSLNSSPCDVKSYGRNWRWNQLARQRCILLCGKDRRREVDARTSAGGTPRDPADRNRCRSIATLFRAKEQDDRGFDPLSRPCRANSGLPWVRTLSKAYGKASSSFSTPRQTG